MITHTMYFDGDAVIETESATVEDVLHWIKRLDGEKNTIVAVTLDNGRSADISGGSDGQYKVGVRVGGHLHDLASGVSNSYKRVPLTYCEDLCFYPEKYIVTLDQALAATRHFCTTGELSPEFSWSSAADYYPFEPDTRAEAEPSASSDPAGM